MHHITYTFQITRQKHLHNNNPLIIFNIAKIIGTKYFIKHSKK